MNKKVLFLIILLSISAIVFVYNDDFLYSKTIMKITNIETIETDVSSNPLGLEEEHYTKEISGIITNGTHKGEKLTLDYEETFSSVVTDKYRVGDKVFVVSNEIDDLKRDFYLVILASVFVLFMFLVGQYRGLLAILSVIFNSLVFYFGLILYQNHMNLTLICIVESIIFMFSSLFIANGINKKSMVAILSTFVSMTVLFILTFVLIKCIDYSGINFNEISFITVPYADVILPGLFIGALGAVMDVAITIASSIGELIEKDSKISAKALNKSGKEIGKDIMSTMINVLFFTYLCSGLPVFVLAIRNGFSIFNYISTNFSLELTRFLVGSIGIVMTIPISIFIAIKILKKGSEISE